ncbi:ras-related Rab-23 [Labeo rohita]|uniref:small monomeric GTPase n=1 Tax=Labeo rohita TaxID=84645 RepID=A0A498P1D0_LABRO|nr:ras-related Rab-23 [Labeo rohita]
MKVIETSYSHVVGSSCCNIIDSLEIVNIDHDKIIRSPTRNKIVNGEDVRLMLWDTAGQEEFDAITKAYYRGAQACVLVFSTTDRESFEAISSWREKVEIEVGDIPTVLVQNKIDLLDDTVIKNEEAEGLAKRLKLRFYRTSVKEDLNVNEVFKYLADKYLQRLKQQSAEETEVVHTSSNKIGG